MNTIIVLIIILCLIHWKKDKKQIQAAARRARSSRRRKQTGLFNHEQHRRARQLAKKYKHRRGYCATVEYNIFKQKWGCRVRKHL